MTRTIFNEVRELLFSDYEQKVSFVVAGSKGNTYNVDFIRRENNLTAFCDCRAGISRIQCKHRVNLLMGDVTGLLEGQENLAKLKELFVGTDVEKAFDDFVEAEKQSMQFETKTEAREYLADFKHQLTSAFND